MSDKASRKAKIVEVLQKARSMELQAIHQYMNQHYTLDDLDYGSLAAKLKLIAIDEMRHAEAFAERIKELGGEPTTDLAGSVIKKQSVKEIFPFDANAEDTAIDAYNQFIKVCNDNGDVVTARLFEATIQAELAHMKYFANVGEHISTLGDVYLSRMAGGDADAAPAAV